MISNNRSAKSPLTRLPYAVPPSKRRGILYFEFPIFLLPAVACIPPHKRLKMRSMKIKRQGWDWHNSHPHLLAETKNGLIPNVIRQIDAAVARL